MRGFAVLVLFGVACSSSTGGEPLDGTPLAHAGAGQSGSPGAPVAGASPSAGGAGDPETGGASGGSLAATGGASGATAGQGGGGAGGSGHASAGAPQGGSGATGSAGSAAGGSSGAPQAQGGDSANECTGFVTYTVEAGRCVSVTGDYQQQTGPGCASSTIVSRDHCSTCASWTAVDKSTTVMLALASGATTKQFDAPGGVCPSNCKNICN